MKDSRLYNQNEAPDYYREAYGIDVPPHHISVLNRYGYGPDVLEHKGNQKLFTQASLDEWAKEQGWAQLDAA